jgi:hypothetical protein
MGGSTHAEGALQELEHPRYDDVKDDLLLPSQDNRIILLKLKTICIAHLGYEGITANMVDESTCVFQAGEEGDDSSYDVDSSANLPPNRRLTKPHIEVTKARLTALSIEVVRRHVAYIDEITDPANGTTKSIQKWAKEIVTDKATRECDHSQQRTFEVIVSMFVLTFFDEAIDNDGRHNIGTKPPFLSPGTRSS